jgi:hypothetical protein
MAESQPLALLRPSRMVYAWRLTGGFRVANVLYFRLGRSVVPGKEPGAEIVEWDSGGWKQARDQQAGPVTISLEDLAAKVGFVCVAPYIDPVSMGSSYSPHYVAFFK